MKKSLMDQFTAIFVPINAGYGQGKGGVALSGKTVVEPSLHLPMES